MFRSAITRRSFVTTRRLADDKTITEKIADTVRNAAAALKEDGKIGKECVYRQNRPVPVALILTQILCCPYHRVFGFSFASREDIPH